MIVNHFTQMVTNCLKTNRKLVFRLSFLCSVFFLFAFVKKGIDTPIDRVLISLQRWTDSIPQEKVYLHMDKPYYALGDTIWFKGYVTIGSRHQLSKLSGAVYVDLINTQDSLIRTLKLPVTAGMVMGNFILGDEFDEGSYRIRAYTQWMRNAGDEYFFDRTFTVGNPGSAIISKAIYKYKEIDNKPVLTALLNFTDDKDKAIAERTVRYEIVINKKVVWAQNTRTDALGSINITINNDKAENLASSFIRTTIGGTGNNVVVRSFPIKAGLSQTDVQFFPESGTLINGVNSRVAFKAVGIDGLGLSVKGNVIDETGTTIAPITTLHAGMGTFILRPMEGKTYSAKIDFSDGNTKTYTLPKALNEGYVLSIYQPNNDSILVRIGASVGLQQSNLALVAQTRGEIIYNTPIKINGPTTFIWLRKKAFPTGIAQFTLFKTNGEPVNERIAFIRSDDLMQLSLKTTKSAYKSKEAIKIDLTARDSKGLGSAGNFSVAVIDENKVPVNETDESTIFTNLLLTSDLKGYIEKPNYYFTNINPEVNRALDNLMLTQGYRRFIWKDLNYTVNTKPQFKAEGLGFKVSGTVQSLAHKLLKDAKVNLISLRAGIMKGTTTDSLGHFVFDGIFLTDSIKFSVEARDAKNSDKVKITLDSVPKLAQSTNKNLGDINTDINTSLKKYIENGKKLDDIYEQYGQLDKVQRLREVRIKARRVPTPPPNLKRQGIFQIPEQSADKVIIIPEKELMDCASLAMCLQARILGVKVTTSGGRSSLSDLRGGAIGLIVDGRKLAGDEVSEALDFSIEPQDVAKILVVRTNMAMTSILGGAYVMIQTRPVSARKQYNPNVANIDPKGFNKVREFYSPRYDKPGSTKMPDLRSTIYWNPYLKTDTDGNTSFSYFNADGPGNYKVVVEGLNAEGELARQVYHYTVEARQANTANVQTPGTVDKNLALITKPLDNLNARMPVEKLYLHTDKPYYNIGDTLWFKSYLIDPVSFTGSKISKMLYVEIYSDSTGLVRRISVPVKEGLGNGQIAIIPAIFKDGGYTLRAYTNWMKNFGKNYIFSRRFYIAKPSKNTWLVKSNASINQIGDKDQLQVDLKLSRPDKLFSPIALKKVEVKIFDEWHYIYKEAMQTGIDGSIKLSQVLNPKSDRSKLRVQLTSLEKNEGKILQVPLNIDRGYNIDLQFLPEGGYMVGGLKTTVGFKAIGMDGRGITVSGNVYDSKGQQVAAFTSLSKGIGSFEFTPKFGEHYTARITQLAYKIFNLPDVRATGTTVHISNPEKSENLEITLNGLNRLKNDSALYLIGRSKGVIYYSQKVELNKPNITIAKKLFPSGVAKVTLFKGITPLTERATFIDNNDQLDIKINANKSSYNRRDSVALTIEVKDKSGIPVKGSFSLAVTDDSQVKADSLGNFNLATSLLLNSEIRGTVEDPGYYINRKDKNAWAALDNLMLTQGWTGYSWKDVFTPTHPVQFEAEKDFKISGKVVSLGNKPQPNLPVLISSQKPAFITTTTTDSTGVFTFKNLPVIDSGSFFLQAKNKKGKDLTFGMLIVDRFKPLDNPQNAIFTLPWYINSDSMQLNYAKRKIEKDNEDDLKLNGNVLKEVKITSKKIIKDSFNPYGPGNSDISLDAKDIKESAAANLYDLLIQKLPNFKNLGKDTMAWRDPFNIITVPTITFSDYTVGKRDLRIDGWPLAIAPDADPVEELSEIKATNIKGIEIIYSRPYTNRSVIVDGLLEMNFNRAGTFAKIIITTYNGVGWFREQKVGTATYRPLPVMRPQQFYSPKYNISTSKIGDLDSRPTLFWEPNVNTDQNGKAKVYFYTSDIKSKYTVKIAGIDLNGGIGDATIKLNNITTTP